MTPARGLRLIAVLIALAGAADPSWSRAMSVPRAIRISVIDRPTLDLPSEGGTRRVEALASAARLPRSVERGLRRRPPGAVRSIARSLSGE